MNIDEIDNICVQKSRGVLFSRSPKRRRQLAVRRTLLGDSETSKLYKFTEYDIETQDYISLLNII